MRSSASSRAFLLLSAAALTAAGCYEVPPEIPAGYRERGAPEGWPPSAVYDSDPLHPANRWRQRVSLIRGGVGDGPVDHGAASGEPPLASRIDGADRAEIIALLESLTREGLPATADPVTRRLLQGDLLVERKRLASEGAVEELLDAYESAARAVSSGSPPWRPEFVPPPLREGDWLGAVGSETGGGGGDEARESTFQRFYLQRGTEDLEAGDSPSLEPAVPRRALLLRRALYLETSRGGGQPRPSNLAVEAWDLEVVPEGVQASLWRLDPRLWRKGGEPWRRTLLEGSRRLACLACHPSRGPLRGRPAGLRKVPERENHEP